jgi:unsaturated chondroitin disaccharide hydrolase
MGEASLTATRSAIWDDALDRMIERVRQTLDSGIEGFPHIGDPKTGAWTTSPDGFWTGGFWVGMLWLAHRYTGDAVFERAAEHWLRRLSSRVDSRTVFRGLLFYPAAVVGAELTGNAYARDVAIQAARSLGQQFSPVAGLIPLGKEAEEAHTVGDDDANIDGVISAPLMLWAAKAAGGDAELREKALSHAYKSAEFFVQPDNSVIQSATFDGKTGAVLRRYTHKGIAEDSIWTRAQAWAMLGYSLSAMIEPNEPRLAKLAQNVSSWWLAHAPADKVAYWDFSAPVTPETWRDTSGTAIAAASLIKTASVTGDAHYAAAADETVRALVERHLTPVGHNDSRPIGILADGCFDVRHSVALSNELIWGDYFLFEALGRLSGRLGSARI